MGQGAEVKKKISDEKLRTDIAKIMWDFRNNARFNSSASKWVSQILSLIAGREK